MAEKKLGEFATPNNDYLRTPITQPAIAAEDYEIKPHYLSLVQQNQFGGSAVEDAGMHLNTFTEICDMMRIKDVDPDAVKLRLFLFSLRGRAKEWLLSLPKNTIASWVECTSLFMTKFFPPAKTMQLRSNITGFRQEEREPLELAWERMKECIRNCPSHGMEDWLILHLFIMLVILCLSLCLILQLEEHLWASKLLKPSNCLTICREPCPMACRKIKHQESELRHTGGEYGTHC